MLASSAKRQRDLGLDGAKRVTLAGWMDIVILGLTLPHPPGRIGSTKEVPYGADDG